jgi:hypothetical protein
LAIDGTYECEVKTPMGTMPVKMKLTSEGDILGGSCSTAQGEQVISGKLPAPDEIVFSTKVKGPMGHMNLNVSGKIKGDEIIGQVKAGIFGKALFQGKKIKVADSTNKPDTKDTMGKTAKG